MPKPGKGRGLVDDEIDAWDYADSYTEEEYWREKRQQAKERGEEEEEKPKPAPKPKAAPEPKEKPAPKPKALPAPPPPKEDEVLGDGPEPVLEQFDDWEAAMDALDAHMAAQEEKKVVTATQKKG